MTDEERILLEGAMLEVKKFQSGKSALSHPNKQTQMMGCALFAYMCANVDVKVYPRQLNQAVVDVLEESIDQEVLSEVFVETVDLKDMYETVWPIHPDHKLTHSVADRFLNNHTHPHNHSRPLLFFLPFFLPFRQSEEGKERTGGEGKGFMEDPGDVSVEEVDIRKGT